MQDATPIPPSAEPLLTLIEALIEAGGTSFDRAVEAVRKHNSTKRGGLTLRPGDATPLWNALVVSLRAQVQPKGGQARLARVIGVPRQTVNAWLTGRTRMPDAERTLQLVAWLIATRAGKEPA
jgi:DNA-binding transcriptional regulator YiaG